MFAFPDSFSYSGDEYWSLARGLDSDKANNLDKDLLEGEMTCRWKPWLEEVDEVTRHGKKTAEVLLDNDSETNRALRREIRKLSEAVSKLELEEKRQKGEKKKCRRCLLSRCMRGEGCPAQTRKCNRCGEQGHFSRSILCKGVRKVQEDIPLKQEMVAGVIREGEQDSRIRVSLGITRQGASFGGGRISLFTV